MHGRGLRALRQCVRPSAHAPAQCHDAGMDRADLDVRRHTYALLVELGRPPLVVEVAHRLDTGIAAVRSAWQRLHDTHALVLDGDTSEIRMANPFSAVPTPHRVHAADRDWYANCAWDAFGICAALGVDGVISTACPDCGDQLTVEVRDRTPFSDGALLFHCLVPAAHWWDDIVFT